jgi:hypothetical protein
MYFSLGFILTSLPFLTAALPAKVLTPRGIAMPITKSGSAIDGVIDTSKLRSALSRRLSLQ